VIPLDRVPLVCDALTQFSYDVAEDLLPTRLVLRDGAHRQIDLHPITFDADGDGWQVGAMPDKSECRYPAAGFTAFLRCRRHRSTRRALQHRRSHVAATCHDAATPIGSYGAVRGRAGYAVFSSDENPQAR
jgi:hypothetical protein